MHFVSCSTAQYRLREICDRGERPLRRLAMRLVAGAGEDGHIDRAIAFVLRDLDLPHRAVLVVRTLQDRNGHADVGEVFGNIPVAESWIEPGVVPAAEGVVDVLVPARELFLEIGRLVSRAD